MPSQPRRSVSIATVERNRLLSWWFVVILLLVQRPLFAPNLWWHLARGREVVSGTLAPSRALLTLDSANDADWLSGVPWYLAWAIGGNDALAAVPLLSALVLLLLMSSRLSGEQGSLISLPLILVCLRDGLQPVSEWFDLLGMILIWRVLDADLAVSQRRIATFLTFAAWGNLGPRPIWGLLLLLFYQLTQPSIGPAGKASPGNHVRETTRSSSGADVHHGLILFMMALIGGMFTPRGIWTWHDSLLVFTPATFADVSVFGEAIWRSRFLQSGWDSSDWAFLLLWCGWAIKSVVNWRRLSFRHDVSEQSDAAPHSLTMQSAVALIIPVLAALLCRKNLPVCGLWIALDMLGRNDHRDPVVMVAGRTWRTVTTLVVVLVLAVVDAWGLGPQPCRRFGWGVSQALNPELLDQRFVSTSEKRAVGWAPDGRSVGIVAWLDGGVMMADHPERALLGGRGVQHAALIHDLIGSHRARYQRDDGSWGGWVHQLDEWNVSRLFVPAEQLSLNRALLGTTWKVVDLDSPSIPFVSAHDPQFSENVLETLQQRAFVEVGPWQPTTEIYSGGRWRFDIVELLGGGPDPAPAILQSQLFRSLEIPTASLRALLPVRQQIRHRQLTNEFRACQRDLAYQEWMTFGESSEWRRRIVNSWTEHPDNNRPWLSLIEHQSTDEMWKPAVASYRRGDLTAAVQALPRQSSQQRYAVGMLWLELGNSGEALREFQSLLDSASEPGILVAATYWTEQLKPFVER